jgi:hypothetical protein
MSGRGVMRGDKKNMKPGAPMPAAFAPPSSGCATDVAALGHVVKNATFYI